MVKTAQRHIEIDWIAFTISLKNMTAINGIFDESILDVLKFDKNLRVPGRYF